MKPHIFTASYSLKFTECFHIRGLNVDPCQCEVGIQYLQFIDRSQWDPEEVG